MNINVIYDLEQYSQVLEGVCESLQNKGATVVRSKTLPVKDSSDIDAYLAIQDVAYRHSRTNDAPRFFINHGSSVAKEWNLDFDFDYFLAPTDYWHEGAREKRDDREYTSLLVGGFAKTDKLFNDRNLETSIYDPVVKALISQYKMVTSEKFIAFMPTYKKSLLRSKRGKNWKPAFWFREYDPIKVYEELIKITPNVFVFPHQMDDTNDFDAIPSDRLVKRTSGSIRSLLTTHFPDVIVSDVSGAAFEACGVDIPVVLLGDLPNKVEGVGEEIHLGPYATETNIRKTVEGILENDTFSENRKYWSDKILGTVDGNQSLETVKVILENV